MQKNDHHTLKIYTINHIGTPINSRERSLEFYQQVLGLTVIPHQIEGNRLVWTKTNDGTMVHLIDPPINSSDKPSFHVALEVHDLNPVINILRKHHIETIGEPGIRHDGQQYLFIFDPEGNRIEITTKSNQNPNSRLVDQYGNTHDTDKNIERNSALKSEWKTVDPKRSLNIITIDHVGLPIIDRKRTLPFYRDVLGLTLIPAMEHGDALIWMQTLDGTMIHLIEGAPISHTAFRVQDFDRALSITMEMGIEIIKGPLERLDGQKAFYCYDPDGNRLEFTSSRWLKQPVAPRSVNCCGFTTQ